MLTDLHVRGLGVIPELSVHFEGGMTALTGETGAGKTLLVHALQLVLGGRAQADDIRSGDEEAIVEARFESDAGETTLARTIARRGRSRAWLDGRMAPLTALADVAQGLVDICGQHDRQSLLSQRGQRTLLDAFAGADLGPLADARRSVRELRMRAEALGGSARERARQVDLLAYQVAEIEAAHIDDLAEDEALESQETLLANAATLRACGMDALTALRGRPGPGGEGETSVVDRLMEAARAVTGHARGAASRPQAPTPEGVSGSDLAGLDHVGGRLRTAVREVDEIETALRHIVESLEDDPTRLEAVQERRRLLAGLRRKYGESLADVVAFADAARASLEEIGAKEREASELDARFAEAEGQLAAERTALCEVRTRAAPQLVHAVRTRLRALAMPDADVEVVVDTTGEVSFHLSANRGEPALALSDVASGGELARTMLALRLVVDGGAPTMLFDEVDAGVGGAAALALGASLHEVAQHRQVLVVTHLPQVAAAADHQIAVRKVTGADGRAAVLTEELDPGSRVVELSRMLSGHPDSATARAHAEELLATGAATIFAPPSAKPRCKSR